MKSSAFWSLLILLAFFNSGVLAQSADRSIQSLSFISGCWEINVPEKRRLTSEQWMKPEGNAMVGMSRTIRDGKLSGFEHLRIVSLDTGIFYISKPSQNISETAFKLIKLSTNEAVFENKKHDFPQRIIYKLETSDRLAARIEGAVKGKFQGINFPMTRTACE